MMIVLAKSMILSNIAKNAEPDYYFLSHIIDVYD